MPDQSPPRSWRYPSAAWAIVLASIFVTEYTVMLALPRLMPRGHPLFLEAAVDSVTLTLVLAPIMWVSVVRPLQTIIMIRNRFLTNLFEHVESNKKQVAHELHDGIGQTLSLLVSGLRSAHATLTDPAARKRYEALVQLAQTALQDVKRLAVGLRPGLLDDLGLAVALERLAEDVREHHPLDLTLEVSEIAHVRLPEAVETPVFRIVQESLANVVAHAHARSASVALHMCAGELLVEIADDGRGFNVAEHRARALGRLGLLGLYERTALLGGHIDIRSEPGKGTRITISVPTGGRR
ncbi:sensor histidine kinase [Frigoriglobus tundricola]|uniref:Histidine kinase/HSP90-like ATPase domain-containing protein n=1 Tax=Frigoriglobus tundricola TaxID=2774151 RepID=A0A6M5Z1V3_9BACT|nr:ATP-binding protein [Frigoriglobus tundricola]QJX00159.1 hypothetical protein FTUN_7783 [Frigoriglobus tundricola]